jgi:hypothetical protein
VIDFELEPGEVWMEAAHVEVGDTVHMANSPADWRSPVRATYMNADGYVVLQLENGMDFTLGPGDSVAVERMVPAAEG